MKILYLFFFARMRVPDPRNTIGSAIQQNQDRLRSLRQERAGSVWPDYKAVAGGTDASWPKSIDEWRSILAEKKAVISGTPISQQVSTLLLWKTEPSSPKTDTVARSVSPTPSKPSVNALVATFANPPPAEIQDMSTSLRSILHKLLAAPAAPPGLPPVLQTPATPPSNALTVVPPVQNAPLDHLSFPGDEYALSVQDVMEPVVPWQPIFERDVYKPIPLEFPEPKTKAQLLLERQARAKNNPKI